MANVKIDSAKSKDPSLAGTYKVTAALLNVRAGAGTNKEILVAIPQGQEVKNYGFYTQVDGSKWLCIQFVYKGVTYTGFASGKHLQKQGQQSATPKPVQPSNIPLTGSTNQEKIWNYLKNRLNNEYGAAGIMGNIEAQSSFRPTDLQGKYEKTLGYTNETYTQAVDDGSYTNFVYDHAGYGLVQWTHWSLKQQLYSYVKARNVSIGDLGIQLEFLCYELNKDFPVVWKACTGATNAADPAITMMLKFQRPANQTAENQKRRGQLAQKWYDKFAAKPAYPVPSVTLNTTPTKNVRICHSSIDENGKASGGQPGDQTQKQVCERDWYNGSWNAVLRCNDEDIAMKAATAAKKLVECDLVGYDQSSRNTLYQQLKKNNWSLDNYIKSGVKTESDCSSFIYACYSLYLPNIRSDSNAPTTSIMQEKYKSFGFKIFTSSDYLTQSNYLKIGDILVKAGKHTVMSVNNGIDSEKTPSAPAPNQPVKVEPAKSKDPSLAGTYKATAYLNVRAGAGTDKPILVAIPQGQVVKNYGFYTKVGTSKWLYIQFTYQGKTYTGFASGNYLKKQ